MSTVLRHVVNVLTSGFPHGEGRLSFEELEPLGLFACALNVNGGIPPLALLGGILPLWALGNGGMPGMGVGGAPCGTSRGIYPPFSLMRRRRCSWGCCMLAYGMDMHQGFYPLFFFFFFDSSLKGEERFFFFFEKKSSPFKLGE